MHSEQEIDFCTLGAFILDDIYPAPEEADQGPRLNVIGGAGTFAVIGARLLSPPPLSKSIGWIVDAGTDFPPYVRSTIESWDTGVSLRERAALTTRAWNGYSGNQHRDFKYITEKRRLYPEDLSAELLASKSFHLICDPARCIDLVDGILKRRLESFGPAMRRPIFVWEPSEGVCVPSRLQEYYQALAYVDVFSPNHEELASLFGYSEGAEVAEAAVEQHAQNLLQHGVGSDGKGAIVIRAGAAGCFVLTGFVKRWLPAYHQKSNKVIDPTGGGNTFVGAFTVGLVRTGVDFVEAARWASVAAAFCIEQFGLPTLEPSPRTGEHEKWNGVIVQDRLDEFRHRTI